jgi:tRNA A-37 threonylcarbamoyl transferase component Bud32
MTGNGSIDEDAAQAPEDASSLSTEATLLRQGSSFPPDGNDPLIGQVVGGRYRVEELIGQGGMGRVFKAVHVHMHKTVALKVLRPEMTAIRGVLARFEREAVAAGRISHVNVVAATDFGRMDTNGAFFLVLEYVDGPSLRKELKKGAFSVPRALNVAKQICEALAAAHQQGVIHRDLKPDNISIVDDNGRDLVKVLDFGIAKFSDGAPGAGEGEHQTRFGVVMGTPRYMSPEQATGSPVDHRTDLYALGVILFEMLSGSAPFVATHVNAVLSQQLIAEPPPLPPHVGEDLAQVCRRLLAKDANERPSTAQEVLQLLEAVRVPGEGDASSSWVGRVQTALVPVGQSLLSAFRTTSARTKAVTAPLWRRCTSAVPALAVLERRVSLGRWSAPWGALLGAVCLTGLVVGLFTLSQPNEEPPAVAVDAPKTPPEKPAAASKPKPTEKISREDLEELLAIPVFKRDRQQWLSIAIGHAQFEEWKQSVAAHRNALQLDPSLKSDPELLQRLRDMALRHEVYDAVANVALNLLGEAGLDLMYDVWLSTREDDSRLAIAQAAQKSLGIFRLRGASPALRVTLALQFAKPGECSEVSKALTDALKYADERAVPELEKLRSTTGCGVNKKRDCYPCIRERSAELETAIRLAKGRKAPRFDGQRYVPGQGGTL